MALYSPWFALFACTPSVDDTGVPAPAYAAPDAPGPYIPGTAESTFVGTNGLAYTAQVWFPASAADEDAYRYDDFLEGTARQDAVPDCSQTRPVLVFSHGNSGLRYQSIFLTEHLASHGWVVVAPDHPGNTIFDESASRSELLLRRPVDAIQTFDWLATTEAGANGRLDGCVNADDGYAIAGHSFGGYTTLAVAGATLDAAASAAFCATTSDEWLCQDFADAMAAAAVPSVAAGDPRVWAGVAMAPAGYEVLVGGLADIDVPMLVLGGSLDTLTSMGSQVTPIYDGLAVAPRMLGEVEGAGHFSFSDACAMVPTYEDCSPPFLANEVTHPVIVTAATAFLQWVRGDEQAAAWLPADEPLLSWTETR